MKLINKFTIWYLSITLVVMVAGGVIAYHKVKNEIDRAEIARLKNLNNTVADQMRKGNPINGFTNGRPIIITQLDSAVNTGDFYVTENSFYNTATQRKECRLTVNTFYSIDHRSYKVESYNYITKANEIFKGLLDSFTWILILLLTLVGISARLISNSILSPFYRSLKAIQGFNIKNKKPLVLPRTRTKEFNELNCFLQKMTDKVVEDYASLKEFSENASHELQTPLAIMRSKLDLLVESDINGEQAQLIGNMQKEIEKLSRINQSLVLLNKLEHHEYDKSESILLNQTVQESLDAVEELIDMKSITLKTQISEPVHLNFNRALADILLHNLLSNAIRHNTPNGQIFVCLTPRGLTVKNTGKTPTIPTSQMFQRFKKDNQCAHSVGIGLAIVKQICDLNQFGISYHFKEGWHILDVKFT